MGNVQYTFASSGTISLYQIASSVDPHHNFWSSYTQNIQMDHWPIRKLARQEGGGNTISLSNCRGKTYYHIGYGW